MGVYVIINKLNGKCYVGSGILYVRFRSHLIRVKGNKLVSLAVNKYGIQNFALATAELIVKYLETPENKNRPFSRGICW